MCVGWGGAVVSNFQESEGILKAILKNYINNFAMTSNIWKAGKSGER